MTNNEYSDVTPQIHALAQKMTHNSVIDTDLYSKYNVKRVTLTVRAFSLVLQIFLQSHRISLLTESLFLARVNFVTEAIM
jgi:hypothetical protein